MKAVIHRVATRPDAGLWDIAGRALIVRQLQWLRSMGCTEIAVSLGDDEASDRIAALLLDDPVGRDVLIVLADAHTRPREIATRAGFDPQSCVLAVPADVLCNVELKSVFAIQTSNTIVLRAQAPAIGDGALRPGLVSLLRAQDCHPQVLRASGWGARIRSPQAALALGCAALAGAVSGIEIHGCERARGVWLARGATIDPDATLVAPVFVGTDAVVCSGATVGPAAILGAAVVVEHDAVVKGTVVNDGERVAEFTRREGLVSRSPSSRERPVFDVVRVTHTRWWTRGVALLLGLLLLPLALLPLGTQRRFFDRLLDALYLALRGRRSLVGLRDDNGGLAGGTSPMPIGVFDVEAALYPQHADPSLRHRLRAWYAHAKSPRTDARLLLRALRRRFAR